MIKYRVQEADGFTEFLTLADAEVYAAAEGIVNPTINEIEFEPAVGGFVRSVTARQLRLALAGNGIVLADITAALDGLAEPARTLALIEWRYASTFARDNPLVDEVGTQLGWTTEQLDALWAAALTL